MRRWIAALFIMSMAAPAAANPRELRLPLRDGKLDLVDLAPRVRDLLKTAHLDGLRSEVNLSGLRGSLLVGAMNRALGDGLSLNVDDNTLVLHMDIDRLPHDGAAAKRATRVFTSVAAPNGTAAQNSFYGLLLPQNINVHKRLVVLVHGLDSDRANWNSLSHLLEADGRQVGYFNYPSDQPIAESAKSLAAHMSALHESFPTLDVSVIAHSMGALVAREYIEGPNYPGGIDHLILIAPPNHGSKWVRSRWLLEAQEHYHLWKHEPAWQWTWIITDGLGEAGGDLAPGSRFIKTLNERPRRGVKYTIIAGDRHPAGRLAEKYISRATSTIPASMTRLWGIRQCKNGVNKIAERMCGQTCDSDGPVTIESAKLAGVDDFVLLPADHASLYIGMGGNPPAGWKTIRDRLDQ